MTTTNAAGAPASPVSPATTQKQIAFTTDSRGRVLAFHYNRRAMAWQRMGEDAARLAISTGSAREVAYVRQSLRATAGLRGTR